MTGRFRRFIGVFGVLVACIFYIALSVNAQAAVAGVEGRWEGALAVGQNKLRLVLEISKDASGKLTGTLTSVDQNNARIPIDTIELKDNALHLELKAIFGKFDGTLSKDKTHLTGKWNQGMELPLEFVRTPVKSSAPAASKHKLQLRIADCDSTDSSRSPQRPA